MAHEGEHQRFTVDSTAYMRNLDREDLAGEWIAVHYQDPPRPGSTPGSTTYSLRFPALVVAGYLTEPREVAEKVAAILNKYWDREA